MGMLVADGHGHTNPVGGMGAKAVAKRFAAAGGWFYALVSLPPWSLGMGMDLESHLRVFRTYVEECGRFRERGVECVLILGFHPAEIDRLCEAGLGPG